MKTAIEAIVDAFPDVPILPVIGNNDVAYHDQAPTADMEESYYGDLWKIFFEDVPANAEIVKNETIKETWMTGGWYAYEITPEIMIMNLNGMYPFYENWTQRQRAGEMLDWVEKTLNDN